MADDRSQSPILVASNRGPVSFRRADDGSLRMRRGGGGLVSGLSAIGGRALWVCAALSDADREAARRAPSGRLDLADGADGPDQPVRMLDIDAETFDLAYNRVANTTLWFVHHLLFDTALQPVFDTAQARAWDGYRAYNRAFARALAEAAAPGAAVVVQDYHLSLVPGMLRGLRPDLSIGHFSHTPWAPADYFRMLPEETAREVLLGLLGADRAGFLTRRWAAAFLDCCEQVLDAEVDRAAGVVRHGGRITRIGVHPLGSDGEFLRERAARPDVDARLAELRAEVGDRRVVARVDRTELSKNIVRGLLAFGELLRRWPEWRGRVVHLAFAYPSRQDVPEYRAYTERVCEVAAELNEEFGTADWQPVLLRLDDDFPRSLAAYRMADVALVNPIRDGMNLVAKEMPVVSDTGCAVVLSREAGAAAELGTDALLVNPYDVSGTAEALRRALEMDPAERAARSARLARAATALPPQRWFLDQLDALTA